MRLLRSCFPVRVPGARSNPRQIGYVLTGTVATTVAPKVPTTHHAAAESSNPSLGALQFDVGWCNPGVNWSPAVVIVAGSKFVAKSVKATVLLSALIGTVSASALAVVVAPLAWLIIVFVSVAPS